MTEALSRDRLERILQQALQSTAGDPESCAQVVLQRIGASPLDLAALQSLSWFLMRTQQTARLVRYLAKTAEVHPQLPWGHLLESLYLSTPAIPESLKLAVLSGARAQKKMAELVRSHMLDHFDEKLPEVRASVREQRHLANEQAKARDLAQIEFLRSQGLEEEEERLLSLMVRKFPKDKKIADLWEKKRERKALGLLVRRSSPRKKNHAPLSIYRSVPADLTEMLTAMEVGALELIGQDSLNNELQGDLALMFVFLDHPAGAMSILDDSQITGINEPLVWLRLEVLLQLRRFAELLAEIAKWELQWHQRPECTRAFVYYRALSMWGLGEQVSALAILEDLALVHPDYRSVAWLAHAWREELQT